VAEGVLGGGGIGYTSAGRLEFFKFLTIGYTSAGRLEFFKFWTIGYTSAGRLEFFKFLTVCKKISIQSSISAIPL
jgi:50S ribosomal subunit-associated GTPase HflX